MNWGVKIAALYIGFVALIVFLVSRSMSQKIDLVAEDYYQQELQYQKVIDAGTNQSRLSAPVAVSAAGDSVLFSFPTEFENRELSGTVHFYAPADASQDRKLPFSVTGRRLALSTSDLHKGRYQLKISWNAGQESYYQSSEINL